MPNILLTDVCNQKCPYCFAADLMSQKDKEMPFGNLKTVLDFLEKSGETNVRFMGGEPTLHSRFQKFINYTLSRNFKIHIFTNGLFPSTITGFLAKKGQNIKYSFNINPPNTYSSQKWNQILKNLKTLTPFKNCLIGSVIWQENFSIDYLLDLANKYPVKIIMLRIANPIIGQSNKYVSLNYYPALAKNLIREIEKTDKNRIKIGLGCGFFKKMFTPEQFRILKRYNVANMKWGCDGNSGLFDISPDLSVFRCFPLSNWPGRKLLDFNNVKETESYFAKRMQEYQSRNSDINFIHQGPCFAYLLNH